MNLKGCEEDVKRSKEDRGEGRDEFERLCIY